MGDHAITWNIHPLFRHIKTKEPAKENIKAAFFHAGYKHYDSYCHPKGFKTDAPRSFIYDVVRKWKRIVNQKEGHES